ncbi:hypothetical protein Hdeb2414_s0018g00524021 [Helianthus debilis subsp. tardiflorus]
MATPFFFNRLMYDLKPSLLKSFRDVHSIPRPLLLLAWFRWIVRKFESLVSD